MTECSAAETYARGRSPGAASLRKCLCYNELAECVGKSGSTGGESGELPTRVRRRPYGTRTTTSLDAAPSPL